MKHPLERVFEVQAVTQDFVTCDLTTGYKDKVVTCRIATSDAWKNPSDFARRVLAAESLTTYTTEHTESGVVINPQARREAFTSAKWRPAEYRIGY